MGADRTLVNAAFKEATSRAGVDVPNLKPLYDSNVQNMKAYTGIVTGAIDAFKKDEEALRIGREKQLSGFKEIMNNNYKNLFTEGQNMPQEVVNAVDEVVRKLQDEFEAVNTYGKNDTVENERARTRINAELKKVINQAVNARATFGILGKDTKMWNDGAIKGDVEAMKRMFNLDAVDKDDNVSVYFDDNLKLTFRVVGHAMVDDGLGNMVLGDVSYNMDQLRKNIPEANLEADGVIFETLTSVEKQAETAGTKGVNNWSEEEVNSIFAKQIQTKEDFTNLAFRRIDDVHEQSFRTNLLENMDVAIGTMDATFQGMFKKLLDKNNGGRGDGIIDSEDVAGLSETELAIFKSNYKKMIDVLTDVDNNDFVLDRSKNLLAEYFTGFAEQKYNKAYSDSYKETFKPDDDSNNKIGNYEIGGKRGVFDPMGGTQGSGFRRGLWKNNQQLDVDAQIVKMKKGEVFHDYLGNTWRMGGNGKITGFHAGSTADVIYEWSEKLGAYLDGKEGRAEKWKTFTPNQALDMLFGMGSQNIG